jgi:hypothetical protein
LSSSTLRKSTAWSKFTVGLTLTPQSITTDQTNEDYAGVSLFSGRTANSKAAAKQASIIFSDYYPELLVSESTLFCPSCANARLVQEVLCFSSDHFHLDLLDLYLDSVTRYAAFLGTILSEILILYLLSYSEQDVCSRKWAGDNFGCSASCD